MEKEEVVLAGFPSCPSLLVRLTVSFGTGTVAHKLIQLHDASLPFQTVAAVLLHRNERGCRRVQERWELAVRVCMVSGE